MRHALADFSRNWRRLASFARLRGAGATAVINNIVVFAAFGVALPWRRGVDIFDPFILFAYALIPLLYAIPAVSDLLGGSSGRDFRGAAAKAAAAAAYAWTMMLIVYALAIATVNALYRVRILHPDWRLLGLAVLLGFAVALLTAALTAVIAVLFSPRAARSSMRALVVAVLLVLLFSSRSMPASWRKGPGLTRFALIASAAMVVFSGGLLYALGGRPAKH
jgi:hypothetical protein